VWWPEACFVFLALLVVFSRCVFHLNEGTRCIPKYVYGSFWERMRKYGINYILQMKGG
jgi:hypothetical protein